MIIDNHVHVGWFTDGYHTPREVWHSEMAAGINGMVVSSTSTCAELYKDVLREFKQLKRIGGEKLIPILWLTPRMFKSRCRYALPYLLHSKIKWRGIKLHFVAHPEWAHNEVLLNKALDVARMLKVPVLFHTGDFEHCSAGAFEPVIKNNPDLTFVLAHGRPIEQAIELLHKYPNAYVDTAFMPYNHVQLLVKEGCQSRVLFGTDAPINKIFWPEKSTKSYIREQLNALQEKLEDRDFYDIVSRSIY